MKPAAVVAVAAIVLLFVVFALSVLTTPQFCSYLGLGTPPPDWPSPPNCDTH
jgi:hypothetical protein